MASQIVTGGNNEQVPYNPPYSDGSDGQDGGVVEQIPLNDLGNIPLTPMDGQT